MIVSEGKLMFWTSHEKAEGGAEPDRGSVVPVKFEKVTQTLKGDDGPGKGKIMFRVNWRSTDVADREAHHYILAVKGTHTYEDVAWAIQQDLQGQTPIDQGPARRNAMQRSASVDLKSE